MNYKEQIIKRINSSRRYKFINYIKENKILIEDLKYERHRIIDNSYLKRYIFRGDISNVLENHSQKTQYEYNFFYLNRPRVLIRFEDENFLILKKKIIKLDYDFDEVKKVGSKFKLFKYDERYREGYYNYNLKNISFINQEDFIENNFKNCICLENVNDFKDFFKGYNGYSMKYDDEFFFGKQNDKFVVLDNKDNYIIKTDLNLKKIFDKDDNLIYTIENGFNLNSIFSDSFEKKIFDIGFKTKNLFKTDEHCFELVLNNNLKTTKIIKINLNTKEIKEIKLNAKRIYLDGYGNFRRETKNGKNYLLDNNKNKFVEPNNTYSYRRGNKILKNFEIKYLFDNIKIKENNNFINNKKNFTVYETDNIININSKNFIIGKIENDIIKKNIKKIWDIEYHHSFNFYTINFDNYHCAVFDENFNFCNYIRTEELKIYKLDYESYSKIKGLYLTENEIKILKLKIALT